MSDKQPRTDVVGWFASNGLPYTATVANDVTVVWGIKTVEDMKIMPVEDFVNLFRDETQKIIAIKAARVHEDLVKEAYSAKRSATSLPLNQPASMWARP